MSESLPRAASSASSPGPPEDSAGALVHPVADEGLIAPSRCACCMEASGHPQRLEVTGGPAVVVHYCSECHAHASAGRTRLLAASFAAALLGLSAAAALVLAVGSLQPALQALLAAGAALTPALALLGRAPRGRHTARGSAAWWRPHKPDGWALVCTHPGWAAHVAKANGARWLLLPARPVRWPWPVFVAAGLAALSVPLSHGALGVTVRVLNRHPSTAVLVVDGRHSGVVAPSSSESASAGLRLRLVAGRRHLQLLAHDGRVLADTTATLRPGVDHLVAISPDPVCFWLERSTYGRAAAAGPAREPLVGEGPVWALPGAVDSWFSPNPPTAGGEKRSSGGLLLALRQGPCGPEPLAEPSR